MGADIAPLNVSIWQLIWGRFFIFSAPCPTPYIKRLTTLSYKVLRTPVKNRARKKIPARGPPAQKPSKSYIMQEDETGLWKKIAQKILRL